MKANRWSAAALCLAVSLPCTLPAQRAEPTPEPLEEVGIDQNLDAQIPLDLMFRDEDGNDIRLSDIFNGQRPVILTMNYSDCPMLCSLQLDGLVDGAKEMAWTAGQEYEIVSVSIDPSELPQRARLTKQKYAKAYGRPGGAKGWHFLTGKYENIQTLAQTVGFRYTYVKEQNMYAHAAALMICTPSGRVSKYLFGINYPGQTLKFSLLEAGEGKIGTTLDQALLFCFHYDETSGKYGPAAQRLMSLGGGITVLFILIGLLPVWLKRRRAPTGEELVPDQQKQDPTHPAPLASLLPLAIVGQSFFFPEQGSSYSPIVDNLFYLIFAISMIFFVLIVGVMLFFVIRYRARPGHEVQESPSHSTVLEVVWSIIPAILMGVIFVWGFLGFMEMQAAPDDAYEIQVLGKQWNWSFIYANGYIDNDLHVPLDRPVRLVMTSEDVIHSLYIPDFRIKMDLVPGRYTKTWFRAMQPGEHNLLCAEYCGTKHSSMLAKVVVHPPGEFEKWLEDAANFLDRVTPVEGGEILYNRRGCVQCHSIDGSAKTGPSFKGSYGTMRQLTGGEEVVMDENYIRESVLDPQAKVRAGFRPVMPTFRGTLKDREISAIIEFIKSLK